MSRYGGNRNPFDDDDEAGGFGGGSSSSSRSGGGGGYRGGGQGSYSSSQQRGRVEDDFGGSSRGSYNRGYGGSGLDYGSSKGREGQSSSYQYSGGDYNDSGYGRGYSDEPPPMTDAEFQAKKQEVIHRMEDSSFRSLRSLHDCVRMGTETTEELDRQAEALDRVETKLDQIHVGLDKGERNLRKIKSPFGGMMNYFSKKKSVNEVTDPKGFKPSQQPSSNKKSSGTGGKQQAQAQLPQQTYKSSGSEVVDKNLDLMGKALDDLMGIGELIGEQLDDSTVQIERITYKTDRDDTKMKKLNQGIRKELNK